MLRDKYVYKKDMRNVLEVHILNTQQKVMGANGTGNEGQTGLERKVGPRLRMMCHELRL